MFGLLVIVSGVIGCSEGATSAKGGTPGVLRFGTDVSSDIVVTVHRRRDSGFEVAGFGTTSENGTFVLYAPGATEPLWLQPGEYAVTLESIGPPVQFPRDYGTPKTSPLKVTWSDTMETLELDVPSKLLNP